MLNNSFAKIAVKNDTRNRSWPLHVARVAITAALSLVFWAAVTGCHTAGQPKDSNSIPAPALAAAGVSASPAATNSASLVLHEGDVLTLTFPGAPENNTLQTIRSDGKITLGLGVGDIKVAGMTVDNARQVILAAAGPQLTVKEVNVSVQSAFIVYVTGSVLRPGKIVSDRPVTPLEAIIEAGIDHTKANLAHVIIVRTDEAGHTTRKILDLNKIIKKGASEPFSLKPYDIIYVPEKFSLF